MNRVIIIYVNCLFLRHLSIDNLCGCDIGDVEVSIVAVDYMVVVMMEAAVFVLGLIDVVLVVVLVVLLFLELLVLVFVRCCLRLLVVMFLHSVCVV